MKNSITIIWSFRNRINVLIRSIQTADATCPKDIPFMLVDADSEENSIKQLREFLNTITDRKIRVCETDYRTSLSEAWNIGMMLTDSRYVVFSSSDVEFLNNGWYDIIGDGIRLGQEYLLIENHAVFLFDKKAILKMGWFDEEFKAGPHFDVDFMIRASENGIVVQVRPNMDFYKHGHDDVNVENERIKISDDDERVKDRLPMNDLYNENYFKAKWRSGWEGWHNKAHPPTHISQVKRTKPEIDAHPQYTKKYV